ncbi:MAG: EVE domain-containing protein [Deltaproteobacteria bacterium]|nr:EVE domain-containing protein [Deltaproteobacteria bacterium]
MASIWLFKTEPSAYAYGQLERDRKTVWDGVKNPVARKHIAAVKRGDQVLIYHTGDEKAVIGIAKALSDGYPDPKQKDAKAAVVDLAPVERLARPVTLAELKQRPSLKDFPLVRLPRLSAMPVAAAEWKEIERLSRA